THRRLRINLGIRRRLATLLNGDRRRIELLYSLLFSLKGTPIVYYGDEIGMGDNPFLGDRDGVRTPMQWSPDRNGGFSRADPERLVLPPIMDAMYGYETVNVEAQARDAHSLLNWTRRMLAVRHRHRAFGRGRLRVLYPGNRKVLAFVREFEGEDAEETILCVSNLSRTAQAVELDLSQFAGRMPVDLLGGSVFPPIGQLSYLLTLPRHAFYWFSLAKDTAMPSWRVPPSEALPELATLVIRHEIGELLSPEPKRMIEQEILSPYLTRRRWFAAKDRKVRRIAIARADIIRGRSDDFLLLEIGVATDGGQDSYLLPVGIVWEDEKPPAIVQQLALARVRRHRRVGFLTDAFAIDALPSAVLASLAAGRVERLADGELRWLATSREIPSVPDGAEIHRLSAEQSNTSLILGDIAVLKIIRRVSVGRHPQTEMTRYLTDHGYANSPALFGEIVRVDADGAPQTLLIAEQFVRNQGDAWQWTLDWIGRGIHAAALTGTDDEAGREAVAAYQQFANVIGRRLGELHAVLAAPSDDPAFAPERVEPAEAKAWAARADEELDRACGTLDAFSAWSDEEEQKAAAALIALHRPLGAKLRELAEAGIGTLRTRVHGDFHLGQILVAGGEAILIDFEGEPSKSLAERRVKACPLRDVAGLLRSFDYAAGTIAREPAPAGAPTEERRAELLRHFLTAASTSFLEGYRAAAAAADHKWVPGIRSAKALIELFLIEKAAYEINYEAGNRPTWIGIPLRGLLTLARRLLTRQRESVDA
ncbi:MAG: putative maltokinase, partial [Acetobacteraceae bacterium]